MHTMIGYCRGGIEELKKDLRKLFEEKTVTRLANESETTLRKVLSELIKYD